MGRTARRGRRPVDLAALALACVMAVWTGDAQAQTAPTPTWPGQVQSPLGPLPPDWSVTLTDVIAVFSAPSPEGSITIIAPPVMTIEGDVRSAIIERAPGLNEELFGEARPAGEPRPLPASDAVAPGLMVPLIVALEDGSQARIEATGYPLPGNRMQLFFVAFPETMASDAALIKTARTLIDGWRAAGISVTDSLTSQQQSAPDAAPTDDQPEAATPSPAVPSMPVQPAASPDDQIENVIYFLRYTFDAANPSAAADPVATTALLFKDGRVFEGEFRAPADFDPASRAPGTSGTGRWQRDGEAYALAFSDGTQGTAVAGAAKTFPAPAAMALSGTYRAIGGPATAVLPDEIDFYPDGSLLLKSASPARSGRYAIAQRSIRIEAPGGPPANLLFGFRGDLDAPSLLILGNRIYERS